jgi:acyl carrier protein
MLQKSLNTHFVLFVDAESLVDCVFSVIPRLQVTAESIHSLNVCPVSAHRPHNQSKLFMAKESGDFMHDVQVLSSLKGMAQEVMGADIGADVPLMSAGLDSLAAVELKNSISRKYEVSLPATVAFDYPTLTVSLPNEPTP